jgi:ATP phosphoribosyltransferase regulatory subunit HisZ
VAEVEMQKLLAVQMTIRSFVRAADPSAAHTVPLPNGNIQLSAAEIEAFRADYGNEKSFRADFVGTLMQFAALDARMGAELREFQRTRYTAYNWKPHADALAHLLTVSGTVAEQAAQLSQTAQQRGLADKVKAICESMEKVRVQARAATEALQSIETNE